MRKKRGAEQAKQITLDHVNARPRVGACQMVRSQEDAHAAAADQDAGDLENLVANLEEEKRQDDHADDAPEIEQLRRQDVGVAIRQHGEVVALDVEEAEDKVLPPAAPDDPGPLLEAVVVDGDGQRTTVKGFSSRPVG